jgi:hypothetical protein
MAALFSALAGTVVIAASLGPATATIFALSIAAPTALLSHLALLSRPAPSPQGQAMNAVEWYPAGRIVGWAALIAGALAGILILILGYDQASYREMIRQMFEHSSFKELDRDGTLFTEETITNLSAMIARAAGGLRHRQAHHHAVQSLDSGTVVEASGRARGPGPTLALELQWPRADLRRRSARILHTRTTRPDATDSPEPFCSLVQGLAVIHVYSRGVPLRALLLTASISEFYCWAGLPSPSPSSVSASPCFACATWAATSDRRNHLTRITIRKTKVYTMQVILLERIGASRPNGRCRQR